MEITTAKDGSSYVLTLTGRLDASWCDHVKHALDAAVRTGEHRVLLDMQAVSYISSAGLRVLLSHFKQLKAINGSLGVRHPSAGVREVLELAGLEMLFISDHPSPATSTTETSDTTTTEWEHTSASARFQVFGDHSPEPPISITTLGSIEGLVGGTAASPLQGHKFPPTTFGLGVGALGDDDNASARLGELLAVAGTVAYQPADGSNRPDFLVTQEALVPEAQLMLGMVGGKLPQRLARFETISGHRTVGLAELAATAMELSAAPAVAMVALTETAGLVGAALRQSPATAAARAERFGFPGVRDWLSFSSDRIHRDSTTLIVGVAVRPGSRMDSFMRPLAPGSELLGHFHAAAFPYRPLRKGVIDLTESVADLFDGFALQSVLHLLADSREINGVGESEFYRGALWFGPAEF